MYFYLDENSEEALFDPISQESYYISHDVCVWGSVHRGGFTLPCPFLGGGEEAC